MAELKVTPEELMSYGNQIAEKAEQLNAKVSALHKFIFIGIVEFDGGHLLIGCIHNDRTLSLHSAS